MQSAVFLLCFEKDARCQSRNFENCKVFWEKVTCSVTLYAMLKLFPGLIEKDESLIYFLAGC